MEAREARKCFFAGFSSVTCVAHLFANSGRESGVCSPDVRRWRWPRALERRTVGVCAQSGSAHDAVRIVASADGSDWERAARLRAPRRQTLGAGVSAHGSPLVGPQTDVPATLPAEQRSGLAM